MRKKSDFGNRKVKETMQMKIRSMMLALAAGFAIFATPLGASAATVAKIGTTEYDTVDAAMDAAAASDTATTITLLSDSTDSTVVPTWYIKSDITIDAATKVKATISPTVNAEGVGDSVGGLAYLTSAGASNVRTVTVGENVTLSFPCAKDGLNAFYIGRNGSDDFVPVNLVLNGCVEAYIPYLGAQSTLTISKTGSLKAEWNECLQTRWGSSLTVTGTDGGWSQEKPQASFSYVNQRGGEITFKDTFVKIGLTWGGNWTINNSDNKTDCATKLTLDNTSLDGVSRFTGDGTSAYEIELKNKAKLTIKTDYAGSKGSGYFKNIAVGVVKIEAGSLISAVSVENAGKFVIDATGITEATKVFDYTGADALTLESYGTVEVTGGMAYVEDNDLWVKPLASVAKIGDVGYASLAEAIAAATSGQTITLIADITDTADAKGAAIHYDITGVTIDLNGHTYTHYNYAHVFQGTGGVIKNGKIVCAHYALSDQASWTYGSYALFIGDRVNNGVATTSFTVEDVEITGGINIYKATGVVLRNLKVNGTNYYAVWTQDNSSVTIESGSYASAGVAVLHGFSPSSMTITGGTFTGGDKPVVHSDTTASVAISGGTFDQMVDMKYCAEGFIVEANNDGGYSAVAFVAAKIGETKYPSLASALADVAEGKPLTWVDERAWPEATPVFYNGAFYAATDTKGALEVAIDAANEANADDIAKIYVRPGYETEKGLVIQAHQQMTTSIAIYGNDAKLPGGRHWSVECPSGSCTTDESTAQSLTKNVSLTICNLHNGAGFCCVRKTDYTVDLKLSACTNAFGVMNYTSAATDNKGKTNIAISDCLFDAHAWAGDSANCVAVVGAGTIEIENSTFKGVSVNVKNINGGDNAITVKNCAFTETESGSKNIRVRSFVKGAKATLTVENVTFEGSATKNFELGDNDGEDHGTVAYCISGTAGSLYLYRGTTTAETATLDSSRAYVGDNKNEKIEQGEALAVKATSSDETATVNLVLTDDDIAKVKKSLSVDDTTTSEAVAAKLNEKAVNGNPTWVNIVAGIDETNKVSVATAKNADTNTIDLGLANITAGADVGANVEIAYEIDEVDASGNVEKTGEVKSSAAIDVAAVESNAIFSVKVLVRQNGTTLATVPTTKYVGVQKTTRKAKKTIISVPWHSLADDANISVAELVMTSNLTEGDKLYVYNVTDKRYDVYTLNASKKWEATAIYTIDEKGQMSAESSGKPDGTTIARGSGVWLERQNTDTPIISYGQATNTKQDTAMAAGTKEEPKWSLAAVPSTESVSLATIAAPANSANDKVIVPTDGAPKIFTVKDGTWGYEESVDVVDRWGNKTGGVRIERKTGATLEPGTGFWYLNAGDAKTVTW